MKSEGDARVREVGAGSYMVEVQREPTAAGTISQAHMHFILVRDLLFIRSI